MWFGIYRIDGIVALMIAFYMIAQAFTSFVPLVNILMNAAPDGVDIEKIKKSLCAIKGVKGVHHIHIWSVNEHDVSLECHLEAEDLSLVAEVGKVLKKKFNIHHSTIQLEKDGDCCEKCVL